MTHRYILSCVFAVAILFGSLQHAHGQLNQGGTPFSFDFDNKNLNTVEFVQMDYVDVEALRAEDRINDYKPATPFRFGYNLEVNLNPTNSGVWDEVKEGYNIWRLGISSPGARTINLLFDDYKLPEGATLYIYSKDRKDVIGAFTHRNNQEDGIFATTLVTGDEIIIEYFEPGDVEFEGRLNLAQVTHGYRAYGETDKFGSSGSCNLNVACEEADGWEEQISSAARMVVNGNSWCSGQLINNTDNDGTPYFLSANHCFTNPSAVVFWFNYESETCSNPSTPPSHDALSGAVTVSRNSASDFWLMELNDDIPAEYDLFFSGWNRTEEPEIPGYIFGVHHPSGDIKKFSYLFDGVTASSYLGATGSGDTHWRVGTWADGTTTEPGSSGSALFDGDGRIIGQLHGGYAACGNTLEDWYGRIGTSWEGGGTPATRLKDWLDPGNTGAEVWDGYNPNLGTVDVDAQITSVISPSGTYSPADDITPMVRIRNAGILDLTEASVSYVIEGPETAEESVSWTGNLETGETEDVGFESLNLPVGDYNFTATIMAPGDENPDNDTRSASFRVVDCSQPFTMPFEEDFDNGSGIPDCWSVTDNQGSGQVWQVGNIGSRGIDGNTTSYAYIDSDAFGSGNAQDSDLITPAINMSNYENVELSFQHYFRQFQTSTATLSYSIDDGETWTQLEEWTTNTSNPAVYSALIPELDGQSHVRIKWNYEGSFDWYWSVDNIVLDGDMTGPLPTDPAIVQLVHNSADPALESVDIFIDGELAISGFEFRSSLSGIKLPSEQDIFVGIAPHGSEEIVLGSDALFTENGSYLIVVDGVGAPADFAPNPDGLSTAAAIRVYPDLLDAEVNADENAMYFSHGGTDAGTVRITIGNSPPSAGVSFGDMLTDLPGMESDVNYIYISEPDSDEPIFILEADLSMMSGELIGFYASGFLEPAENQGGAGLMFFAVRENGDMIDLRDVPLSNEHETDVPTEFALEQNYPNPFNPTTSIEYALPEQAQVRLEVYNLMGQRVATLVNGTESAGRHTVSFDASRLSSGMYVYRLEAGSYVETRKMMLVK
ncbi:MAG: choice-of-anchor J domain-containing protein [Balneolia bacterium]|nr:choice-of-anchor J domain-containing protein [Balneolia bacterium]